MRSVGRPFCIYFPCDSQGEVSAASPSKKRKHFKQTPDVATAPTTVVGTAMQHMMSTGYATVQVVRPLQVAQVDMTTVPGLAMGQVAYDANGNPVSVALTPQ